MGRQRKIFKYRGVYLFGFKNYVGAFYTRSGSVISRT